MDSQRLNEDDGEIGRKALRLRERGLTYKAIGKGFGISDGKAHHLVRAADRQARDEAYDVTRPPGKTGERRPERASRLHDRLSLDFRRVHRVIENRVDLDGEDASERLIRRRVARLETDFAEGFGLLAERVAALEGSNQVETRGGGEKRLCRNVERSFAGLLGIAAEVDPILGEERWQAHVRAVFGRDLAELAEILGLACPPAPALPDGEPGLRTPGESEPPAVALDGNARRRRNERIVIARLGGATAAQIGDAEGLSKRQVRRILADHRSGRRVASPAAIEAMDEAVDAIRRQAQEIDGLTEEVDDPATRMRLADQRIGMLGRFVSVLSDGGWLSPESVAEARKAAPAIDGLREELASKANQRLRRLFEAHDVDPELAERAYDEVLIAAGLGEWVSDAAEDDVQA